MSTSPLLRLPAELRNAIYNYVLEPQSVPILSHHWEGVSKARKCPPEYCTLYVNRQLHAETRFLPYNNFTFDFGSTYTLERLVKARTPAQLQAMWHFKFTTWECRGLLCDEGDGDCRGPLYEEWDTWEDEYRGLLYDEWDDRVWRSHNWSPQKLGILARVPELKCLTLINYTGAPCDARVSDGVFVLAAIVRN